MADRAEITELDKIKAYVFAGNATFTVENTTRGTHLTYRVRKVQFDDGKVVWFADLLRGPSNEDDFAYLGMVDPEKITFRLTKKSAAGADAPSVRALSWLFDHLRWDMPFPVGFACYHEGRCGRCNRKLTVPESIQTGLGPICAGREAA